MGAMVTKQSKEAVVRAPRSMSISDLLSHE